MGPPCVPGTRGHGWLFPVCLASLLASSSLTGLSPAPPESVQEGEDGAAGKHLTRPADLITSFAHRGSCLRLPSPWGQVCRHPLGKLITGSSCPLVLPRDSAFHPSSPAPWLSAGCPTVFPLPLPTWPLAASFSHGA